MKLPKKLVSFMESREEILVRQMPTRKAKRQKEMPNNKREKVARWGFKVDQALN